MIIVVACQAELVITLSMLSAMRERKHVNVYHPTCFLSRHCHASRQVESHGMGTAATASSKQHYTQIVLTSIIQYLPQ